MSFFIILNLIIFFIVSCGVIFLIFKLNFDNKNYRLLFILYLFYWIPPILLRNYTSQMHFAINPLAGSTLWIPIVAYGFVGLFWKPLNDLLCFRLRSRKKVIYFSIIIQFLTIIPIIIYPCFLTNVIQSIGIGIGASGLAVFNLMFNEQYSKKKVFLTVSLLSLPPIMADFLTSPLQSLITSFIPLGKIYDVNIMKWLWMIGLIFLFFSFLLTIFVKEDRSLIYQDNKYKQPIKTKSDWFSLVIILLVAILSSFIKFANTGTIAQTQLDYIGDHFNVSVKGYQGYLTIMFSLGQIVGNLVVGLFFVKKMNKWLIFSMACGIWIIFHVLVSLFLNVPCFLFLNILNGLSFGMAYNLIVGLVLDKFFLSTNKITPITLYNTSLSLGICFSNFFTAWLKGKYFNFINKSENSWIQFTKINWVINFVIVGSIALMWCLWTIQYFLVKNNQKCNHKLSC